MTRRICFLSTNDFAFGGSEDLWAATALVMAGSDWQVGVSVHRWDHLPAPIESLVNAGCTMMWHDTPGSIDDFAEIVEFDPQLVVVSQGFQREGLEWIERFVQNQIPFFLINQCVHEAGWVATNDADIDHMVALHSSAREFVFVSEGNRRLYERMAGVRLTNAAVVRNPFKVDHNVKLPWPGGATLQVATVGRLECFHKGYDLLFEVLARPKWHSRALEVHLYGEGPHRRLLERLAQRSGFPAVWFHGQVSDITGIWKRHHVLVQPSRLEGLPMSVVEAMLCGRPVVATDIAGHGEVITDGVTGFLAAAPTPALLDVAMEQMWEARERLEEMSDSVWQSIRALVPAHPAGDLAQRLTRHVEGVMSSPVGGRPAPLTVRVLPKTPRRVDDHHAHLYFAADGSFSEASKVTVGFPRGAWVTLCFRGLRGQIRFDPGARPGFFHVRRLEFFDSHATHPNLVLRGLSLETALRVSGTAVLQSCSEDGLVLASNGDDPILLVTQAFTPQGASFGLEIELYGD